ncbi:MAG: DUF5777 family beta-barrel protein [Chitinophagaceae bacterium]
MKRKLYIPKRRVKIAALLLSCLLLVQGILTAQDSTVVAEESSAPTKAKPVKNTFQSVWIIDNQTVLVPVKKTFEMDIQHRFGTVKKGYEDFWGFFAPSNIRIGFSYVPVNKLNVGVGFTKTTAAIIPEQGVSSVNGPLWDGSLKYSIITQTKGIYPVSVTYYVNAAYNTKKDKAKDVYRNYSDRLSYFHQLLIARKVTDKLSVQVAPSISHHNVVNGYFTKLNDSTLKIKPDMKFDHFAIALSARYKLTDVTSVMINYDQHITKHVSNNPNPSLSFGLEFNTSSHSFQLFATNYFYLVPQINSLYNTNSPFKYTDAAGNKVEGGKFLIGFNITRLWNY